MTLVSAIMPTRGRRQWAQQALDCFLAQTYESANLVILDDDEERSFYFAESYYPKVVHYLVPGKLSIAEKRNLAVQAANGSIICHFDSDDWSAPTRIADQLKLLEESGKDVCGFYGVLFYDEIHKRALKYVSGPDYAVGTSLMYRKSFWEGHRFQKGHPNPNVGEDNRFVRAARDANELVSVDGGSLIVARLHAHNTSVKNPYQGMEYRPVPLEALPAGFSCAPADFQI